ncbi:hypothetical protein [Serratia sp. (in: enterobacteria)]|uniref:hypothetical protein n=1 Tax=Serratia sp. (in: enterobacteria) TaxID=616 RepID=UPI00289E5F16|nr:hypothetical protein [Serratia sp. (in: enterobacteria)]
MTTIRRFTPDYKMHAVRFEAFAREAEHGEYVRFDAHQQTVDALEAERDALQSKCENLEKQISHINTQSLECALKMADAIKVLEERVNTLAVDNAAMRKAIDFATAEDMWIDKGYDHFEYRYQEWYVDVLNAAAEIPATDAALAAIQAQGVEKFVTKIAKQLREAGGERGYNLVDWCEYADHLEDRGEKFATELREAK